MEFSDWLFGTSGAQSAEEANANLQRQREERLKQLRARLDAGTITPVQLEELARLEGNDPSFYSADSYLDAGWDTFQTEAWNNTKNLPGTIAGGAGKALGSINGEFLKGFFKGWANPVTVIGGLILAGVLAWAFLKGPLKGAKVKVIPI